MIRNIRVEHQIHQERGEPKVTILVEDSLSPEIVHGVEVLEKDYVRWFNEGRLVQVCFPYLSSSDREILITGLGPQSWDLTIGPDEEEPQNPEIPDSSSATNDDPSEEIPF